MAFIPGGGKITAQVAPAEEEFDMGGGDTTSADDEAELWEKQQRTIQAQNLANKNEKPIFGTLADPSTWLRNLNDDLYKEFSILGEAYGLSGGQIHSLFASNIGSLNDYLINSFMPDQAKYASLGGLGTGFYTDTDAGAAWLLDYGKRWFESKITGLDFDVDIPGSGPGSYRGSSGSRGPTAEEIRNQFDLDQLATGATSLWRGWLLEEPTDARGMARAYVDEIVATGGEKEIDFTEFIRNRANQTSRWASIYKGKPGSMSEEQFLQPYFQAASQLLSPRQADQVAIRGAQFAASGQEFQQMVNRDDSITGSAPYIASMQQKMNQVSGILKG